MKTLDRCLPRHSAFDSLRIMGRYPSFRGILTSCAVGHSGRHSMKSITLIMISFCTTCSSGVSQEDYDRVVAE